MEEAEKRKEMLSLECSVRRGGQSEAEVGGEHVGRFPGTSSHSCSVPLKMGSAHEAQGPRHPSHSKCPKLGTPGPGLWERRPFPSSWDN